MSNTDEIIIPGSQADLFPVGKGFTPADIGIAVLEMIMVMLPAGPGQVIGKLAVGHGIRRKTEIRTGLVQCYRIKGGQHAEVRQDRSVIFPVAVAVGGNVHDQADMETGLSAADGGGVFRHFTSQHISGCVEGRMDGIKGAGADTSSAALADILHDKCFAAFVGDRVGTAFPGAFTAGTAQIRTDDRLAVAVLLHFSGPASAAHAQIFDRTAEAGHFMSLEVIEGDDDIRVIQCTADISLFAVFTAGNGNGDVIGSLQAVADDDIAACGDAVEAVDFRVVQIPRRSSGCRDRGYCSP